MGPQDERSGRGRTTLHFEELMMVTSPVRGEGFREPSPPVRRRVVGGTVWVMAVVCRPVTVVAVVLVAPARPEGWVVITRALCALLMAVMMRGMGEDLGRR